ncbi:uncharacterized protein JCM10292_004882 [Rhodotorula paludigena]|uniref:uncharacterized protein n=1 Tax=Rhodotorula paludigena TaxID=86838 RepID=UPI00317679DB
MPSPPLASSSSSTLPASTSSPSSSSSRPRSSNRPAPSTPSRPLPSSSSTAATGGGGGVGASSPAYTTSLRSRHSLYGTEDRVVLDLGASVCRAGFSGEPAPRACLGVRAERVKSGSGAAARGEEREGRGWWTLEKGEASEEEWEVREERVKRVLRRVYFENLMIDPKTRKVIVLENPLLPTRVKELIARVLFDNLQVPSLSFASTPLLALMAARTLTGLVVDVGHLETTVLPIFHSRPLFPHLTTTPRAGARLTRRLRALLLAYGSYAPPPSSLNSLTPPVIGRIPPRVLTDELVEGVKDRMCFVGEAVPPAPLGAREASVSSAAETSVEHSSEEEEDDADPDALLVKHLYERYAASAPSTTSVSFAVPTPSGSAAPASGVGNGWVQVPGWVRERAAEVLFEEGGLEDGSEGEESGLAGVVLDCLLKLPIDLRKPMASSILVIGGTSMLPGFFPRFKASLLSQLERSHPPSPPPSPPLAPAAPSDPEPMSTDSSPAPASSIPPSDSSAPRAEHTAKVRRRHALGARLHTLRHSPRYAPLVPLAPHLAILNHPSPSSSPSPSPLASSSSSLARAREGSAPAFAPALMGWIGGSLAGALKIGGEEISREVWDGMVAPAPARRGRGGSGEEGALGGEEEGAGEEAGERRERGRGRLPDWTRLA